MAELQRSTSVTKTALVKNPSTSKSGRRVAFEVPNQRRTGLSDIDTDIDHLEKGRRRPYYFACCVWGCIVVFTLVIILVIMGISYLAFLQAGMPQVNVRYVTMDKLKVDNSKRTDATVALGILISNKNDKLKLLYGPLTIDVKSEDVQLGQENIRGFSQNPQNDTKLDVKMTISNPNADADAVNDIRSDMTFHEMVFDVYLSGTIGFEVGSLHMSTVPFLATCHQVQQQVLDFGGKPKCDVKMFSLRPSGN